MLENLEPVKRVLPCKMRNIIANLEPEDRDILNVALADTVKWQDWPLYRALEERGIQVSPNVLTKHRRNLCSCRLINA
jgi:hypothetical protein